MENLSNTNNHSFNPAFRSLPERQTSQNHFTVARNDGKKSFLVFKQNKYLLIPTKNIAYFYIKYNAPVIVCFDNQEYSVNYSLEQIQQLLPGLLFYRLNRQYLINFNSIKEVEHYFARKLLVKLNVPVPEKLLVSKEKATQFLRWLENR